MVDTPTGDLYVWCRPAFESAVIDLLAWAYSGSHVHASGVLGLMMFRLSVPAPQGQYLDVLNALVTYGAGAIIYHWFESVSQA
jgi:hypothetical protein